MILQDLLKQEKINQSQLSKELNISVSLLSKIIKGERNISVNLANKLHKKYNIDYAILLSRSNANE
jgi:transcriptional regulator with XRE-family HTH domain|tara:strand:- start:257 stop:454 length:198 start_codon:yes stop_codon:yes gene_type:complete